eukprot:11163869-Lingulodinium_polyedra.AAC.1
MITRRDAARREVFVGCMPAHLCEAKHIHALGLHRAMEGGPKIAVGADMPAVRKTTNVTIAGRNPPLDH